MERIKENAKNDFINMIQNSWTYNKLTQKEQKNLKNLLCSEHIENILKGTYKQRYEILYGIYYSFLIALDYKSIGWREKEEIPLF